MASVKENECDNFVPYVVFTREDCPTDSPISEPRPELRLSLSSPREGISQKC
jgi:hypothetical protein